VYEIGRTAARDLTDIGNDDDETATKHLTQVSWFREPELPGQGTNPQSPDGKVSDLGALELTGKSSFLQVHDVPVRRRFDPLQSDNYPGRFMFAGSSLALLLAFLGIGYYLRQYFGLHPR
jgi:hypothetical protein